MSEEMDVSFESHDVNTETETENETETTAFKRKCDELIKQFVEWNESNKMIFIREIFARLNQDQLMEINDIIIPKLRRDFITLLAKRGLIHIVHNILQYLDKDSLAAAELVSKDWLNVISDEMLWKKSIEHKYRTNPLWQHLFYIRNWRRYLFNSMKCDLSKKFYRSLYHQALKNLNQAEENWKNGKFKITRINCQSVTSKGVYCLQYDEHKIVSGLRDNTIKIWDRSDLKCVKTLTGHTGSVLCLQYDDKVIISGSSDSTVRVWDVITGDMVNTLIHHSEAVLHLRFNNGMLVTCSKDRSIAVWNMTSINDISLRRVLFGHRAAVNVVDFDEKYIVSASGDRTIKVWNTSTCEFVRTLVGHKRGIACLQYRDRLIVSGSSDNSIRIWNIEIGNCLRVLEGHDDLVRCIRFDSRYIISGSYDGTIKVWDWNAALDKTVSNEVLCLQSFREHTGRVFRIQFDGFQIISGSYDDTILIWDFLN